tara:strand:+ start:47 stop:1090 length:1044 start_codon:yes stop_codon:yes gene_type:complete
MAKKDNTNEIDDKVMFDTMPGADKKTAEDVEGFKVDMNFEDNDEVEFPKEDEIEEVEEEQEPTPDTEETQESETEEGETEEVETADAVAESDAEEGVLESDEGDSSEPQETVEESDDEGLPKEPMIPKSRFDEVLAKQKALQKKLEEATMPQVEDVKEAPNFNFEEKEIEYQNAVLDGETEKAANVRNEIRQAEKQQMMFEMQAKMGQTMTQTNEMAELQAKAQEIQNAFPILDENSADYNEAKASEVMELRDAYMIQGYTGALALQKATDLIMGQVQETPNPVQEKVTEKKKVANTKKKIKAAESQPPSMKGQSKTEKKIDLNVLSTEEFDALPEETLKRMRGDFG